MNQQKIKSNQQYTRKDELTVVMDGYEDWTPFAILRSADEAVKLRDALSEDAPAFCTTAPYYSSKQSVKNNNPTNPPTDCEELVVVFESESVIGISDDDWVARELQVIRGGVRGDVTVYDTFGELVEEKPQATGEFISSDVSVDDFMDSVR